MVAKKVINEYIEKLAEPSSPYYGGSAIFMLDTLKLIELYFKLYDQKEALRFIAYGADAVEGDAKAFAEKNAKKLWRKIGEYEIYAVYIKKIGLKHRDKFLVRSLAGLNPIIDDLGKRAKRKVKEKQADQRRLTLALTGKSAFYKASATFIKKRLSPAEEIPDYEARIVLALFKKLLLRRARLKARPPVNLVETLRLIDEWEKGATLSKYQNLLTLKKAATKIFRRTKSSVRYDYRFIAREIDAIAQVG